MAFLEENLMIDSMMSYDRCEGLMAREPGRFRCKSQSCRSEKSLLHGSFFAGSKLPPTDILRLGYFWVAKTPFSLACIYTGQSTKTVAAYYGYYRQVVIESLDEEDSIIGGPGIIVELDESKFGKRKYNRGHRVEGCWVLGGVERTESRKIFVKVVPDRSAATLLAVISDHVREGSIILTDLWKGYKQLNAELGFDHYCVNHSAHFRDPETGVHTNTIEGTWNGIKMSIAPRGRVVDGMNDRLLEFIWRRKNAASLWNGLIRSIRMVQYTVTSKTVTMFSSVNKSW
jgi:transposase-like protein